MYRSKKHILYAKLLLTIFVAGQIILFTHQHEIGKCCGEVSLRHYSKNGFHAHKPDIQNCLLCEVITNKKLLVSGLYVPIIYFTVIQKHVFYFYKIRNALKKLKQSRGPPFA
jgi:hypothetical protein